MNRITAVFAAVAVYAGTLPVIATGSVAMVAMTGCSVNALDMAKIFVASEQAFVNADPNAPYVGDLDIAITAEQTAIANWNGSTALCAFQSAANTAVAIIDQTDPNSQLALIAGAVVAAYDVYLAATGKSCTTALAKVSANGHTLRSGAEYNTVHTHLEHAWFPTRAYRGDFNDAAKRSGLAVRI